MFETFNSRSFFPALWTWLPSDLQKKDLVFNIHKICSSVFHLQDFFIQTNVISHEHSSVSLQLKGTNWNTFADAFYVHDKLSFMWLLGKGKFSTTNLTWTLVFRQTTICTNMCIVFSLPLNHNLHSVQIFVYMEKTIYRHFTISQNMYAYWSA